MMSASFESLVSGFLQIMGGLEGRSSPGGCERKNNGETQCNECPFRFGRCGSREGKRRWLRRMDGWS